MIVIRFEPKEDITTYELAQLIRCSTHKSQAKEEFDKMPDNVRRHVVIVSDDSNVKKSWIDKIKDLF
jgi:hypothetical protein